MTGALIFVIYAFAVLVTMVLLAGAVALFVMAAGAAVRERFSVNSANSDQVEPQPQTGASTTIRLPEVTGEEKKAA